MFTKFECSISAVASFLNTGINLHEIALRQFGKTSMKPKRNFPGGKVGGPGV